MKKLSGPTFTFKVTPEEKALAEKVRKEFESVLKIQKQLLSYLDTFFQEFSKVTEFSGIEKMAPLLTRFIQKYRDIFNEYVSAVEKAVQLITSSFKDADMNNARDLVVESVKDVRNNSKDLIAAFSNVGNEAFSKTVNEIYSKIKDRITKLELLVSDELFGHIDYNILGKIRLSHRQIPLSIKLG